MEFSFFPVSEEHNENQKSTITKIKMPITHQSFFDPSIQQATLKE
jgi:hypothetical protein